MTDGGDQVPERAHNDLFDRIREGWMRPVLAQAPISVLVIDRKSIVQDISRRGEDINPNVVIGRSVYDFVDPSYHDATRRAIQKVLAGGEHVSFPSLAGEVNARAYY